jgi:UDP-N-acetylglucosamine acyltransferase
MAKISRKAIVEKGAHLAKDVCVGPFAYIGPEVRIAAGCIIENNATVVGRTALGEKTHVFPMAVIGTPPDGEDETGQCNIGAANAVRENVTIYGGVDKVTQIGANNLIMVACSIGAGAHVGDHTILDNCSHICQGATVEDYVRTSGFTIIQRERTVGAYSFTAGYVEIDRDAPPYAMIHGAPFRVRGVNTRNLRRCGFDEEDIRSLKLAFRELFNGRGIDVDQEVLRRFLSRSDMSPHLRRLADAIEHSGPVGEDDDA